MWVPETSMLPCEQVYGDQKGGLSDVESEWVAVDLSAEDSVSNGLDTCSLNLRVIRLNAGANGGMTEAASNPNLDDGSLACNECTGSNSVSCQQQQELPQQKIQHQQPDIACNLQTILEENEQRLVGPCKVQDTASGSANNLAIPRTASTISTDSLADCCRICQQPTDEPLIELGCHCRGELAKAHRSCIQQWFNNKGSNKCEVCRHVATNLPAPASQPLQNFWAWRISRSYRGRPFRRWQRRGQFHPLLAALLILVAGLLFDILISYYLGASALPVNIIIGVLVVLGLGTAARLIVECCHERNIRRRIRRMEMEADLEQLQSSNGLQ